MRQLPEDAHPVSPEERLAEVREALLLQFPCRHWEAGDDQADGTVIFSCECGAATARYASYAEGERALDRHLDEMHEGRKAHLAAWAGSQDEPGTGFVRYAQPERRRWEHIAYRVERQQPRQPFRDLHPRAGVQPEPLDAASQVGLVSVVLSRQALVGVVDVRIVALARRLGLRLERSFGEVCACDVAYFETGTDRFTVIRWDDADPTRTEVHAYVEHQTAQPHGAVELDRFLDLAGLTATDVHFPRRARLAGRPDPLDEVEAGLDDGPEVGGALE